jgi:hypothetical protein
MARDPFGKAQHELIFSAKPGSVKQVADRAEELRFRALRLKWTLSLQARPQAKPRRLRGMAAPAVLPAAHTAATLLHR